MKERHEKLMDYLIDLADYINQVIATLRCDICGLKTEKKAKPNHFQT